MKLIINILFFILTFSNLFGQTKGEIVEWISNKLNQYANSTELSWDENELALSFDDNIKLTQKINLYGLSTGKGKIENVWYIPVLDIKSIYFLENPEYVEFQILTKPGGIIQYYTVTNGKIEFKDLVSKASFSLKKEFLKENLDKRMKKAFSDLISIYGGKMEDELY